MEDFEYFEDEFIQFMKNKGNSERTIVNRLFTIKKFFKQYHILNEENYNAYYEYMLDNHKPATINAHILTLNLYIQFLEKKYNLSLDNFSAKTVKVNKVQFLEDICTLEEYLFFMGKAKAMGKDKLYIACKIMATTGMRIHELLNIRREHIEIGFIDFIGKGGKQRRCYFTPNTQKEVLEILDKRNVKDKQAYIISANWDGQKQNWQSLNSLKKSISEFAENECEFRKGLFHSHAFRHFFAKNFVRKHQNIALLADLLGHSSLETTRIYLKYTSREQQEIVNEVVTW